MAKALKTAAIVVGGVALIASGVGAAVGAGILAASATTAAIGTVATIASAAAGVLTLASSAAAPKGTLGGNPQTFTIDKESGIPIAFGRTMAGGRVVHRQWYGAKQQRESWVTVRSLGPIKSMEPLQIAKTAVSFDSGGQAIGFYRGNAWMDQQLGACPETRALAGPTGDFPGWGAASKLSGLAADLVTLDFDTKSEKFPNGVPPLDRVVEGVFAWDPRLDDTYPGGVGPQRQTDPDTHGYTENPWLLGLQYGVGFVQNGTLVAGGGLALKGIDVDSFVEAANIADAMGWKAGGIVFSAVDNDWDILQMLAQAGGGECFPVGGLLSCTWSAPRVSIGTITQDDIIGAVDAPSTVSRRLRRNTVIPKVRLESHGWEMVPLSALTIDEYVTVDRGKRPIEMTFPLVQQEKQGAELGVLAMLDKRELDPITLPCKIYTIGYRPGDCVTLDLTDANLIDRDVVLRTREMDGGSLGVTFTARTETPGKHSYATGAVGTPPPTPDLSTTVPDRAAPHPEEWVLTGETLSANGVSIPALVLAGAVGNPNGEAVIVDFRVHVDGQAAEAGWIAAGSEFPTLTRREITGVTPGTAYDVSIRYRVHGVATARLVLGPVVSGGFGTAPAERAAFHLVSRSVAHPVTSDDDSVTIAAFTGVLDDSRSIEFPADELAAASGTTYGVFYDLAQGSYSITQSPALDDWASSALAFLGWISTSTGGAYPSQPTPPGGWGGSGQYPETMQ